MAPLTQPYAIQDTISNGSESFVFQCGVAGSVSEVLELQSLHL